MIAKPIWQKMLEFDIHKGRGPSLPQLYFKVAQESVHVGVAHNKAPPGYGFAYYVEDALDRHHVGFLWPFDTSIKSTVDNLWNSNGRGPPISAASPTDQTGSTVTPPVSGGKREAPSKKGSQALGARASGDAKHRRGKCPKGHYWSYKHKKCVKSKF